MTCLRATENIYPVRESTELHLRGHSAIGGVPHCDLFYVEKKNMYDDDDQCFCVVFYRAFDVLSMVQRQNMAHIWHLGKLRLRTNGYSFFQSTLPSY